MSVSDVVAVVLLNNESLRAGLERVGVAVGALVDAGSVSNPEVELESYFSVTEDAPFALEVAILQGLNDFVIRGHRRTAARHELAKTKAALTGRILRHAADARTAAYDYLAARELLELRREVRHAAESSHAMAARLYAAGNSSKLDVKRRRLAREEARLDERMAERKLTMARERLTRLMSLYGEHAATWEISAELPEVPADDGLPLGDLESVAVASSVELEAGRLGLEASAARGRSAAASAWPHVALGAVAEMEPSEAAVAIGPALEFELPIFRFGKGAIDAAEAELVARKHEYAQQAIDVRSAARDARAALAESGDRARFLRDVVLPLRRDVTNETLRMYNGMYVGVFELLQVKREEIEAKARWIEAVRDYWSARTRVELAIEGAMPDAASPETTSGSARPAPTSDAH